MKTSPSLSGSAKPNPWAWHLRTLNRLRARLTGEVAEHLHETLTPVRGNNDDFADVARETSEHELLYAEMAAEGDQLAEVEAALERLRLGTYGLCAETGERIDPERLRAIPWTRFCLVAAQRQETARPHPRTKTT
jgi:RNA polymerase-binding transcription factor DksA